MKRPALQNQRIGVLRMAIRVRKVLRTVLFYPSDLVNTKTTIPLRVGEERWIYTLYLDASRLAIYSPPLRGIVV